MLYLKKYFTEGLIQVAILLSLAGMRVDHYLPPLREIILGQSSALMQTQFHNLHNSLDGNDLHPKSVDLDGFFTARRLLGWVRSLDRLQVPTAELEAWLVHREPEGLVSVPGQGGTLEVSNGLEDSGDPSGLTMRMGGGGGVAELGYGPVAEDNLGAVALLPRDQQQDDNDDLIKEDVDMTNFLWRQEVDQNVEQEVLLYGCHQQPREALLSSLDEDEEGEGEFGSETWRDRRPFQNQMDSVFGEDTHDQLADSEAQTSLSLQECLRLLEANFPLGEEPELLEPNLRGVGEEDQFPAQRPLLSPLLPQEEPSLDLEQQWQDLLAIMELQDDGMGDTVPGSSGAEGANEATSMDTYVKDVSLHQSTPPRSSYNPCPFSGPMEGVASLDTSLHCLTSSNDSNLNLAFGDPDMIPFLPIALNRTVGNDDSGDSVLPSSFLEDQALPDHLNHFLEEAMLDEISLMDLALEEGFSHTRVSQLEEQLDSDSGLSLDFSQSPASPSGSESSCSSSSSSCSSSSISSGSLTEEGALGYSPDSEDMTGLGEGAVGDYKPELDKMCHASYLEPSCFQQPPWLEHVGHDHTYNQPLSSSPNQRKSPKQCYDEPLEPEVPDKLLSRDEHRAHSMKIPFSNECIINTPVEEFNELLVKYRLSEAQLTLIRDIRRRGKNKMAAQNCRQRKLDTLLGIEHSVEGLRRHRARLLREKSEVLRSVREMKQRVSSLYQEVFSRLRDEQGRAYPADDYALQLGSDGHVVLSSRHRMNTQSRRKPSKKQKDKKK